MKPITATLALLFCLTAAAPAFGAAIDLQQAKCRDIMTLHEDDAVLLYFWLDGYLYRDKELPVLDLDAAAKAIAHMASYCADNPDSTLRQALQPPAPAE